jgi:NAD(P)-dependent dehydrogenase (short-subunit alcohol dehydrogenase family)
MSMQGKRVLVTGATSGIGQVAALTLAREGAELLLVGRDVLRAEATAQQVRQVAPTARVEVLLADLSSQAQVRRLAEDVKRRWDRLDVLLNNAGALIPTRQVTVDGLEMTFALNHLGYFLLTHLLRPLLEAAPSARVVNVASEASRMGRMHFGDLQLERGYSPMKAYSQSKLANILFTRELARRLSGTRVSTTVLHPGFVASNFGSTHRLINLFYKVARPFALTPEQGADTAIYLASSPEVEGVSGEYFIKRKRRRPAPQGRDDAAAKRLWEESERLTGLAG